MGDGLVDGGAGGAQMREFRIVAVAAQHVDRRQRPRRALVSRGALHDDPVDAPGGALRRGIGHILEAAIDDRLEPIELRLRLPADIAALAPLTPMFRSARLVLLMGSARVAGAAFAIVAGGRAALIPAMFLALVALRAAMAPAMTRRTIASRPLRVLAGPGLRDCVRRG